MPEENADTNPEETEAPTKTPAKAKLPSQNGVTQPGEGSKTRRVWDISSELSTEDGPAPRADVLNQAEEEGINKATAATQYGRWRKFHGYKGTGREKE